MDIAVSVLGKVAENLVDLTIRQGQYLFCIKKFIKDLEATKDTLTSKRDSIQNLAEEAKKRTEIIEKHVEKWIDDVKNLQDEAEKLKQEVEANNNCFQGCCPPWKRYRLCQQMAKKTEKMTELMNKNDFKPFSYLASLPGIEYESSDNFSYFNSTKVAYNRIMEALQDDNTHIIGLYGMAGVGKTSLALEVGKKAKELDLFDLVMRVTVSQTPNIRKIQEEMADFLKLNFQEYSEEARKQRLWLRLKQEKRVLIIVDDVWGEINLKDIGVDFDASQKGKCKILLTTRRQQVCTLMGCHGKIMLELLSEEEAWTLFRKYAGIDEQYSYNILNMAWKVTEECKGLPIAIKVVASSLKGIFDVDEWKVALKKLKDSKPLDEEGEKTFFSLKLSYDYLKNKEAQLLFLMCAMFPEDHEISVEKLIRYGAGLGVRGEFESFDFARSRVKVGLNKLLDSCLLMQSKKRDDHVKMHDLVRDTALWISSEQDKTILVNTETDLSSFVGDGVTKNCFAMSSWYRDAREISCQWDAPKLEILIVNTGYSRGGLSCASFDGMKGLKVMAIINEIIDSPLSLPESIQSLTNLRTLCLRKWDLGDIFLIVSLGKLEVLDLQYCSFKEVPEGIENLHKLRLLDLTESRVMESYNSKAIARCPQLQELYVSGSSFVMNKYPPQCFVHDLAFKNLQRCELILGTNPLRFLAKPYAFSTKDVSNLRIIKIKDFDVSAIVGSKNHLLQRAEEVDFVGLHGGWKNIISDMVQVVGGMTELRKLILSSCEQIECLTDADSFQEDALLPRPVNLWLGNLPNLKELCRGRPVLCFFEKLEELGISECQNLSNIFPREGKLCNLKVLSLKFCGVVTVFSMSVARSLEQLEELNVKYCENLRHIITSEGDEISPALNSSNSIFPNLKKVDVNECYMLQSVFPISCGQQGLAQLQEITIHGCDELKYVFGPYDHEHNNSFPNLKKVDVYNCNMLQSVFPISCGQQGLAQLQEIEISDCDELKYVFGPYDHENNNSSHDQNEIQIMLPSLQTFGLSWLGNLIGICPQNCHASLPSLKEVDWRHCPGFTAMWNIGSQQHPDVINNDHRKHLIFKLEVMNLSDLSELKFICYSPQTLNFKNLQSLQVTSCSRQKYIFPRAIHINLPELASLSIENCDELEEIIAKNEEEPQNHSNAQVCLPKLVTLSIGNCNQLKSLFSIATLPKLDALNIRNCAQLKEIFRSTANEEEIVLPNLEWIQLVGLPSLVNIFPGFMLHKQMQLKYLFIERCPNFAPRASQVVPLPHIMEDGIILWEINTSSNQLSQQQMLPATLQSFLNIESIDLGFNCRVEGILKIQVEGVLHVAQNSLDSNLSQLILHDLLELRYIWSGPISFLGFHKLEDVYLWDCPKLKTIFPPDVVGSLQNLKVLSISNCEELEEIIMSSDLKVVCFPRLVWFEVKKCNKIKCLFSGSVGCDFPQLSTLDIKECNKLKYLFSGATICNLANLSDINIQECSELERVFHFKPTEVGDDENKDHREWQLVLPKLKELELQSLPNFTESEKLNMQVIRQ